jgi:hypothetical protein
MTRCMASHGCFMHGLGRMSRGLRLDACVSRLGRTMSQRRHVATLIAPLWQNFADVLKNVFSERD